MSEFYQGVEVCCKQIWEHWILQRWESWHSTDPTKLLAVKVFRIVELSSVRDRGKTQPSRVRWSAGCGHGVHRLYGLLPLYCLTAATDWFRPVMPRLVGWFRARQPACCYTARYGPVTLLDQGKPFTWFKKKPSSTIMGWKNGREFKTFYLYSLDFGC